MTPSITFIIPSYNAEAKLGRCLSSLDLMHAALPEIEAVFVDDCSTDASYSLIEAFAEGRDWVRCRRLPANSGTPSVPRNVGLAEASGEYVFFFDCDDELLPAGVLAELDRARATGADVVRAPLLRDDGRERKRMNHIPDWGALTTHRDRVAAVVRHQSTTVCGLYRRSHLLDEGLEWPTGQWMGEDAVYLYRLIRSARLEYVDEPDFVYHTALVAGSSSSTQRYEERELENHIEVWRTASEVLAPQGVDYFATRGHVALQAVISSMIRRNRGGFSKQALERMRALLLEHEEVVRGYPYGRRFAEIRDLLLDGSFAELHEKIKLRLLIAGDDLKFIMPFVPRLQDHFQVQVDEWTGHAAHDEAKSRRLLGWADVIHCEWLLGNAVWYSEHKRPEQRLIVRMHRFELTREFGHRVRREHIDRIVSIAPRTLEQMQSTFGFDREKVRYLPNAVDVERFRRSDSPEKVYRLAMIGSQPALKGYHRALELLHELRQIDPRYHLSVYGKRHTELSWVRNDPKERAYFEACDQYLCEKGLDGAVTFEGWVTTHEAIADRGFILSMSDLEGSHQAVAEGFAAGNISVLLPWEGAEYLYPRDYIFEDVYAMRDYILECRDYAVFSERARKGHEVVKALYDLERFVDGYVNLVDEAL